MYRVIYYTECYAATWKANIPTIDEAKAVAGKVPSSDGEAYIDEVHIVDENDTIIW
jgi:hypothetical protein